MESKTSFTSVNVYAGLKKTLLIPVGKLLCLNTAALCLERKEMTTTRKEPQQHKYIKIQIQKDSVRTQKRWIIQVCNRGIDVECRAGNSDDINNDVNNDYDDGENNGRRKKNLFKKL